MKLAPSPLTASFAGFFSALTWPLLWKHYGQATSSGSVELIAGTLLLVALPAHALVLGLGHRTTRARWTRPCSSASVPGWPPQA